MTEDLKMAAKILKGFVTVPLGIVTYIGTYLMMTLATVFVMPISKSWHMGRLVAEQTMVSHYLAKVDASNITTTEQAKADSFGSYL